MANDLRHFLHQLLVDWQKGKLSAREVHKIAEQEWDSENEWPSLPDSHPDSIPIEVLSQLELMFQQQIIANDIDAILAFLATKRGEELDGWRSWTEYWNNVDWSARSEYLKSHPLYSQLSIERGD